VTRGTPARQSHRPEVPETAAEQDAAVRDLAEIELAQLETQGVEVEVTDTSDSSDTEYRPPPRFSPRPHDPEASGSSSAPRTDPIVITLLERLIVAQERQEAAQQSRLSSQLQLSQRFALTRMPSSSSNLRSSVSRPSFRDSSSRLSSSTSGLLSSWCRWQEFPYPRVLFRRLQRYSSEGFRASHSLSVSLWDRDHLLHLLSRSHSRLCP
jgi:hypothetical protein